MSLILPYQRSVRNCSKCTPLTSTARTLAYLIQTIIICNSDAQSWLQFKIHQTSERAAIIARGQPTEWAIWCNYLPASYCMFQLLPKLSNYPMIQVDGCCPTNCQKSRSRLSLFTKLCPTKFYRKGTCTLPILQGGIDSQTKTNVTSFTI